MCLPPTSSESSESVGGLPGGTRMEEGHNKIINACNPPLPKSLQSVTVVEWRRQGKPAGDNKLVGQKTENFGRFLFGSHGSLVEHWRVVVR